MAVVVSDLQVWIPPQNLSKNEFTNMVEKLPQNMLNFQYHTYEHILLRKKLREKKNVKC